jgi:hypothetical protein
MQPPNNRPHHAPPEVLTMGEASRWGGIHRNHLHAACAIGALPAVEIEGRRFIRSADLGAFLESKGFRMMGGAK